MFEMCALIVEMCALTLEMSYFCCKTLNSIGNLVDKGICTQHTIYIVTAVIVYN